jgi:DNA adenine methylase
VKQPQLAIPPTVAHPFLKYAGGKTALLSEILPRLPKKIKTYYEPFVGGGAVFFALAAEERFKEAIISDSNSELVSTYATLWTPWVEEVIDRLKWHAKKHSEAHYYEVRGLDIRAGRHSVERAARMIYLNRTCFNGLYRVNKGGRFNVPFGRYANPTICDEENLRAVAKLFNERVRADKMKVGIATSDFENAIVFARRGDAVYFDPPYVPASATANFTAYSKDGFGPLDQMRLCRVATKLARKGVHVLLSNSDTPFVRKLYKGFKIERVEAPRRINSKGGKRGNVGELLISGRRT